MQTTLGRAILATEDCGAGLKREADEVAERGKQEARQAELQAIAERNAPHEKALTEDLTTMASSWAKPPEVRAFLSALGDLVPAAEMSDG